MCKLTAHTSIGYKTASLLCGLVLSLSAYSQADTLQPTPKTFIFSKYKLSTQGASTVSFFSAPLKPSPYKIHYKIKTLTFPSDPNPKPKRFNLIDAIITGYIEGKEEEENKNNFLVPVKKN